MGHYDWTVATCVAPGTRFKIQISVPGEDSDLAAPVYSTAFEIRVPDFPCSAGLAK